MSDSPNPIRAAAAGILLFIAGLAVGVYTFEEYRTEADRLAIAARADGIVTGHLNGRPLVTFVIPGGDRVSFTATTVGRDDYREGKKVDVLYRMDKPTEAIIDRPHARWGRYIALGGLAAIVMGLGAYIARAARRYDVSRLSNS